MYYYDILVADISYKGVALLTYSCVQLLEPRQLVGLRLRNKLTTGIVIAKTTKPDGIKVKPLERVITQEQLPTWYIPLIEWMSNYYPASRSEVANTAIPSSLRTYKPTDKKAQALQPTTLNKLPKHIDPPLTPLQKTAIQSIREARQGSVLLHGVTGSGKTRIYIELIQETLSSGKSAFVLTPEISLTPQLQKNIEEYFGNRVFVTHSGLSSAKRRDIWLRILKQTEPIIVIGPRSALFAPVLNIGLIIIDEAHDLSYKQDQIPHYHTSRVAATLARQTKAKLILGTATPSVVDYFTFSSKNLPIITLDKQAIEQTHSTSKQIIRLDERSLFSASSWISDPVLAAIKAAMQRGEQSLIYLNRRGTARLVVCQACDWQATCPVCDMNYVYHGDSHSLRCHSCGTNRKAYTSCPECSSNDIILRSAGTKMIQEELGRLLPDARIARFDTDNNPEESMQHMYKQLHEGTVDVAIGTQTIGKGLDLPKLCVVAILQADSSLALPDYVAEEELFQHIHQLIGRIGRGHRAGQAYIQTRQPDHPVIASAISGDYKEFYEAELKKRRQHLFPPYAHLLKVQVDYSNRDGSRKLLEEIKNTTLQKHPNVSILGPAPAYKEKVGTSYRWQLIIKAKQRETLVDIARHLPQKCRFDIDPSRML
jgi:primosomal protein N' (replication factor Y)